MSFPLTPYPAALPTFFRGPALSEGEKPTIFYFALAAEDSLETAPFSTPVEQWLEEGARVFSVTLPFHEKGQFRNNQGLNFLIETIHAYLNQDPQVLRFISEICELIEELNEKKLISKLGLAGLSRGSFIATHVAAKCSQRAALLGFAPLCSFNTIVLPEEVSSTFAPDYNKRLAEMDLTQLFPELVGLPTRFFVGNLDERIGTSHVFSFIEGLAKKSQEEKIKSPQVELFIHPSIGHRGHGTPEEIFIQGALWLMEQLKAKS